MKIDTFNFAQKPSPREKEELIQFLLCHLEQYGDSRDDIQKALGYALKEYPSFGGFILRGQKNEETVAVVVVNQTGMSGYIPENILVYVATHKNYRGMGLGKGIMQKAIAVAEGNIALHVEASNPAKILYEKLGFTNPYLEMRLKKE